MKLNRACRRLGFLFGDAESPRSTFPLVEIAGNVRALIENHNGISEYCSKSIRVKIKDGCICVVGKGLCLSQISKERVVITGHLESVVLQGDE